MKTIKAHKKVVWAIEHRKNCMLKDPNSTTGVCLYSTKAAAQWVIDNAALDAKPIKVLVTIERTSFYV
jgi:hypothetical protein